MGPEFWTLDKGTKLKKCSEKRTQPCSDETDGCCAVVACEYCLEFAVPDEDTQYGIATESGGQWSGSIAGLSFLAYWERYNYCEFVVELDGVEVYRNDCGGSVTCRNSSDSASVFIYPDTGTLSWTKRDFRPLEHATDEYTNCKTFFCGECECTCQALCVTVTLPAVEPPVEFDPYECDGLLPICGMCPAIPEDLSVHGELNDTSDPCDGPDWTGTVAGLAFVIHLRRGPAGECILSGTAGGETLEEVEVGDCKSISATWTLYDGTAVSVACKVCDCETDPPPEVSDCCDSVPCTYCVTLECYGEDPIIVESDYLNGGWDGTIDGNTFSMYWTRDEYGECIFVVEFNGVIIYSKSIAEGQTCDDNSDSVALVLSYLDCTLTWTKHEPRPLPHITDPDSYEIVPFCGTSSCTCSCLCVTVSGIDGTFVGEICDTAYSLCDGPVWEGSVGGYDILLTVVRDRVGVCVMVPTIDGEQQNDYVVEVTGDFFPYSITLYNGTVITFACKICECDVQDSCACCPGWPQAASGNVSWTAEADAGAVNCGAGDTTGSDLFGCDGTLSDTGTLLSIGGQELWVRVWCDNVYGDWHVQYRSNFSTGVHAEPPAADAWADAEVDFVCPDCADAVGGIATGTIDFIALQSCEHSGPGIDYYGVLVHGDVEIPC